MELKQNREGLSVSFKCFVFSNPVENKGELDKWLDWFKKRGIYAFIRNRTDGRYDLIREGVEVPTDMDCEPTEGPCLFCGTDPPHNINHYKYCSDECMNMDRMIKRRKYGNE